jgi:hypothetical protein
MEGNAAHDPGRQAGQGIGALQQNERQTWEAMTDVTGKGRTEPGHGPGGPSSGTARPTGSSLSVRGVLKERNG